MDSKIVDTIQRCVEASHRGAISFGEVVGALMQQGVESYRVDFRTRVADYYLPSGETHSVPFREQASSIADTFDAQAIAAAVQGAQRGEVKYPEFVERSVRAGCVGYVVWIAGRHVSYFGRRGETHIERFPGQ